MEEAWEPAVVSKAAFTDWSGRHTRLRYQSVLFAFLSLLSVMLGVSTIKIPGVLTFEKTIPEYLLVLGVFSFAIFSLISFRYQHAIETKGNPDLVKELNRYLLRLKHSLTGDDYNVVGFFKLALQTLPEDLSNMDFKVKKDALSAARPFIRHWSSLDVYYKTIQSSKDDIKKLSPGGLSLGNNIIRNFDIVMSKGEQAEVKMENLLRLAAGGGRWDYAEYSEFRFMLKTIELKITEMNDDITALVKDLNRYQKLLKMHSSWLSYRLPFWLSISLLSITLLHLLCGWLIK